MYNSSRPLSSNEMPQDPSGCKDGGVENPHGTLWVDNSCRFVVDDWLAIVAKQIGSLQIKKAVEKNFIHVFSGLWKFMWFVIARLENEESGGR